MRGSHPAIQVVRVATVVGTLLSTAIVTGVASDPASAAFPGQNGRLVFEREAPAGNHTQTDLYTVEPDGSQLTRLTDTPNRNEFGATWDAAGTEIAFWRTRAPFGPGSIWVMDAHGQNARRLTRGIDARDPAWSPAGNRIVFTRGGRNGFDLWTIRASDGGGARRLTSGPALDFEPAWSPDGLRIAFTRGFAQGDPGNIYVLDRASGRLTRITHSPAYDHQVNWAPGGHRLVFERDFGNFSSIFTVRADGSGFTRLTSGPFFDVGPAFSPNGRRIVFASDRGGGTFDDLWMMNATGTDLHRVMHLHFSEGAPDWQPLSSVQRPLADTAMR